MGDDLAWDTGACMYTVSCCTHDITYVRASLRYVTYVLKGRRGRTVCSLVRTRTLVQYSVIFCGNFVNRTVPRIQDYKNWHPTNWSDIRLCDHSFWSQRWARFNCQLFPPITMLSILFTIIVLKQSEPSICGKNYPPS